MMITLLSFDKLRFHFSNESCSSALDKHAIVGMRGGYLAKVIT